MFRLWNRVGSPSADVPDYGIPTGNQLPRHQVDSHTLEFLLRPSTCGPDAGNSKPETLCFGW